MKRQFALPAQPRFEELVARYVERIRRAYELPADYPGFEKLHELASPQVTGPSPDVDEPPHS